MTNVERIHPRDHSGMEILDSSECRRLLGTVPIGRVVAFEIDGWGPAVRRGWSVVARGRSRAVTDLEELTALEALDIHPWLEGVGMRRIEIRIDHLTGRRLPPS